MKYKINKNNNKAVQSYMKDVLKFLKEKSGITQDSWTASLVMIEDNYSTFLKCQKQLNEEGLTVNDRFGSTVKHPLIKVQNDAQIQLVKLLNEFGLTLKSSDKINSIEKTDDNSALSKFINNSIKQ